MNSSKATPKSIFHTMKEAPKVKPQKAEQKVDIPEVLAETDNRVERENTIHKKKLLQICEGYSEDEVHIACVVFARKYPEIMFSALSEEHRNMVELVDGVSNLNSFYQRKMNGGL